MQAHESPRQPTTANKGQGRPTAANDGQRRPTQAHEDKKGPNDASGVVWALGVFFQLSFVSYLCITLTTRLWRGNEEENGPKRRIWRRLGLWYVFFALLCIFFPN